MTSHSVVERMVADLAERRRQTIGRTAAYIALARAIVSEETTASEEHGAVPLFAGRVTPIRQTIAA